MYCFLHILFFFHFLNFLKISINLCKWENRGAERLSHFPGAWSYKLLGLDFESSLHDPKPHGLLYRCPSAEGVRRHLGAPRRCICRVDGGFRGALKGLNAIGLVAAARSGRGEGFANVSKKRGKKQGREENKGLFALHSKVTFQVTEKQEGWRGSGCRGLCVCHSVSSLCGTRLLSVCLHSQGPQTVFWCVVFWSHSKDGHLR